MSKNTVDRPSRIKTFVLACFFLSGMTGLTYEILWTRMIVKVIGGAPFAISIILTVFMAGLGLGSYIASRKIDQIKDPLKLVRIYGILEVIIAAYCFVLPLLLVALKPIYAAFYNAFFTSFMFYSIITFLACAIILILPVICMGATLPILCRFYVTRLSHLGGHIGRLYGLNTIGAAAGSLLSGFWLIRAFGMTGTLVIAVTVNAIIGLLCIVVSYRIKPADDATEQPEQSDNIAVGDDQPTHDRSLARCALWIFAVSGFCAMVYEVIWTKLLGLIIAPTTYSFTIVLVTFITGLAFGAMVFGRWADRTKNPMRLLILSQIAAAVFALFVSHLLGNSQFFFAKLIYHYQDKFITLNLLKAIVLFCFILPPTLCLGATFPLVGKILTTSVSNIARCVGFAYAINTVGAVLGSFCAGFVIIPLVGKESGLKIVVALQIIVVLVVVLKMTKVSRTWRPWIVPACCAVPALLACGFFPEWNTLLLAKGRYQRLGSIEAQVEQTGWIDALWNGQEIIAGHFSEKVVFHGDGVAGFTAVLYFDLLLGGDNYSIFISGKADASTYNDMATQVMSAHIPMAFHPNPKNIMVLGLASGITAGETLNYPIEKLDILEINKQVVQASEFFKPWNSNVLQDPRTELIVQDGRAHLQLTDRTYDVIISEPSNPWMAGLAALFTQDFFDAANDRLNDKGIFVQFIHSYQMDWDSFAMVCRTFADVFPNNALLHTRGGDFLMVGLKGIDKLDLENARENFEFIQKSKNVNILDHRILVTMIISEDLAHLSGPGPLNSDRWPRLEFDAPKLMYHKLQQSNMQSRIRERSKLSPHTKAMVLQVMNDVDMRLKLLAMALSLNRESYSLVDPSTVTPAQKEQYFKLIEDYATDHPVDFSLITDQELARRCVIAQIENLKGRLNTSADPAVVYRSIGTFYRAIQQSTEAEKYFQKAAEYQK